MGAAERHLLPYAGKDGVLPPYSAVSRAVAQRVFASFLAWKTRNPHFTGWNP